MISACLVDMCRGLGGIFFDDFKTKNIEDSYNFVKVSTHLYISPAPSLPPSFCLLLLQLSSVNYQNLIKI